MNLWISLCLKILVNWEDLKHAITLENINSNIKTKRRREVDKHLQQKISYREWNEKTTTTLHQ